jgi:segregation and condensation protein B
MDSETPTNSTGSESDSGAEHSDAPTPRSDDHTLAEAVEAIIFAADEPVAADRISSIVAEVTGNSDLTETDVADAVDQLNEEYETTDRSLRIRAWAGGYRMTTRSALSPFVKTLFIGEQETTLSQSLMETLAVIAYKQPVTRPEVDFIRGVNSDYAIRKLLEMDLADVEGRADSLGRPLLYGTTDRFLEQFGLDSTEDLPTLREVEELLDDPAFDEERAQLLKLDAEEDMDVDAVPTAEIEEKDEEGEEA